MAPDDSSDWLELTDQPLSSPAAMEFLSDPAAGAIDIFLGTTRSESNPDGRQLVALDYEAYNEMARNQFLALAESARNRWPIRKLVILHRLGRVAVGEPSVLIAVSTPHRSDAFEACRWLIDALKKDVAIWKKELWADGSTSWVHPHP
jgi:molybdopterin synthase catalytic subunit